MQVQALIKALEVKHAELNQSVAALGSLRVQHRQQHPAGSGGSSTASSSSDAVLRQMELRVVQLEDEVAEAEAELREAEEKLRVAEAELVRGMGGGASRVGCRLRMRWRRPRPSWPSALQS